MLDPKELLKELADCVKSRGKHDVAIELMRNGLNISAVEKLVSGRYPDKRMSFEFYEAIFDVIDAKPKRKGAQRDV